MAAPGAPDPLEEIAALRAEIAELRARIAALEGLLGGAAAAPAAGAWEEAAPEAVASIEPEEPWGLKPPTGSAEP
jgi:hypothetical protein